MILDQIKFERNYNALAINCYSCSQKGHLANHCPLIHYIPDPEKIVNKYMYNPGQNSRFDVLRNPAKSWNARSSKTEINTAFLRFQRLLRQLYVMENDTVLDSAVLSGQTSPMNRADISPIALTSDKSNFTASMLKTQSLQKAESQLKLFLCDGEREEEQGRENENSNYSFNDFEKANKPNNKISLFNIPDNLNKDPNDLKMSLDNERKTEGMENFNKRIFIPEIRQDSDEVLPKDPRSDHSSPSQKRKYLKINTGVKSARVRSHSQRKKQRPLDAKLLEILEVNSLANSSPEKRSKQTVKDDTFEFLKAEEDNNMESFDFKQMNLEGQLMEVGNIDNRDKNIEKKQKMSDNFFPKLDTKDNVINIESENSDRRIMFNFELSHSDHLDNRFEENLDKRKAITEEESNKEILDSHIPMSSYIKKNSGGPSSDINRRVGSSYTPPSLKGEDKKQLFKSQRKQIKTRSTVVSNTQQVAGVFGNKEKRVNELFYSPLLKLPIYNTDSPFLVRNKSSFEPKKERKTTEGNTTIISPNDLNPKEKANESFVSNEQLDFDRVSHFKNYHPENNVKNIIKKMMKAKMDDMKRHQKARGFTKNIKNYFEKVGHNPSHNSERRKYIYNRVVPLLSPVSSPLKRSSEPNRIASSKNLSDPRTTKRPSSIFVSSTRNKNFFQHESNEVTFYDVVYEVLTNKELRKKLLLEKMKSKMKKSSRKEHIVN